MILDTMILRHDMLQQDDIASNMTRINGALVEVCKLCGNRDPQRWHPTRLVEYPWAITVAPPTGHILDVGSNPQFSMALVGMGHNVTVHHTRHDVDHLGRIFAWEEDGRGGIQTKPIYKAFHDRLQMVVGTPYHLPFIKDEAFDTIYNISVMEHVEPELFEDWFRSTWRMLKVGGRMVLTCDFLTEWALGDGFVNDCFNHDFTNVLAEVGIEVPPTVPFSKDFDRNEFHKPGVASFKYPGIEQDFTVYGFVLEKRA